MIQILGLRETTLPTGKVKLTDCFFEKGWQVPDIFDLFANMEEYISRIPEDLRWNLFYTVANNTDQKRIYASQSVIPLDIDGIDKGTEELVTSLVLEELGLSHDEVGIVYSGNGVHILIGIREPMMGNFIEDHKAYYKALCGRVNQCLFNEGVKGKSDTTAFSKARILRLPFTRNVKKDKPETVCRLIGKNLIPLDTDLFKLADMPEVPAGQFIHRTALARMPDPDQKAIEAGCSFIRNCRETRESITEPEWYAMLSVVGRFKDGDKWIHEYSRTQGNRHPNYDFDQTEMKAKRALDASGPRTCENISQMWEGCATCPNFNKVTSPIQITGSETIVTEHSGFYETVYTDKGPKRGKPSYDDLEKKFRQDHKYITTEDSRQVLVWNGMFWEEMMPARIHSYAEKHFDPTPSAGMCMEFESKLKRCFLVEREELNQMDKLNFENGVLDLDTGMLSPHDDSMIFTYVIPYAYNPKGDCPQFKKFLNDVACDDMEIAQMLAEYVGYCISGTDPELVQKCALLYGDGSNGKSVLLGLMREMVGVQNCSAIGITSLGKDTHRFQLMNKLFNACAESPKDSFLDSEMFKSMVSGDTLEVRRLYGDPVMWKCTTKLMFACNELPFSGDFSHGLYRRLIILPFRATFSREKGNLDPLIHQKLATEKSDIFKYCLEAFAECKKRGYKFIEPTAAVEEMEDYKEMGDIVSRFVYGMCNYSTEITVPTIHLDTVYNMFALWCKENNQHLIGYGAFARRFGKILQKRHPSIEKTRPRSDSVDGGRGTAYKHLVINAMSAASF